MSVDAWLFRYGARMVRRIDAQKLADRINEKRKRLADKAANALEHAQDGEPADDLLDAIAQKILEVENLL